MFDELLLREQIYKKARKHSNQVIYINFRKLPSEGINIINV